MAATRGLTWHSGLRADGIPSDGYRIAVLRTARDGGRYEAVVDVADDLLFHAAGRPLLFAAILGNALSSVRQEAARRGEDLPEILPKRMPRRLWSLFVHRWNPWRAS